MDFTSSLSNYIRFIVFSIHRVRLIHGRLVELETNVVHV